VFDTYTEIFGERAGSYHSAMKRWPSARDAEFRAALEPLSDMPAGIVCDMPSGGCYLAEYLHPGMRYYGVEPSGGFFDNDDDKSDVRLVAPIVDVPLPNGSVDYIVSLAALHHEPNLTAVFDEMRRLLKADGRIVIADVQIDTGPARFLNGFVNRNNPMGHDGRFLTGGTADLLSASGFAVLDEALVEVPWSFDSMEDAGTFCSDLFGIVGPGRRSTADALADEIGFHTDGPTLQLRWVLRRIVARPS
jgi:SAM-dependent methyltransferase